MGNGDHNSSRYAMLAACRWAACLWSGSAGCETVRKLLIGSDLLRRAGRAADRKAVAGACSGAGSLKRTDTGNQCGARSPGRGSWPTVGNKHRSEKPSVIPQAKWPDVSLMVPVELRQNLLDVGQRDSHGGKRRHRREPDRPSDEPGVGP